MSGLTVSVVPREARSFQGRPAGVVSRLVAASIDAVVVMVTLAIGYGVLAGAIFVLSPRHFSFPEGSRWLNVTTVLVVLAAYLALSWSVTGRSYGDEVMGLRVVDRRGRRPGPVVAIARALICAIFPIGLFWCGLSRSGRAVHDVLLRTAVVYDWRHENGPADPRAPA